MSSFYFTKEDGKVQGREWLWTNVKNKMLSLPDGEYIWPHPEKPKRSRSNQQNRYYWGVVVKIMADHTGYLPEEMHQIMAEKYLSYKKKGRIFIQSTTKLRTSEFETYMEACRRFAAMELQCFVPLPNEPGNFYYDMPHENTS